MWEHTFTNHNSPRGELWHKVVLFFVVPAFSKLKCHYLNVIAFMGEELLCQPAWKKKEKRRTISSSLKIKENANG